MMDPIHSSTYGQNGSSGESSYSDNDYTAERVLKKEVSFT